MVERALLGRFPPVTAPTAELPVSMAGRSQLKASVASRLNKRVAPRCVSAFPN